MHYSIYGVQLVLVADFSLVQLVLVADISVMHIPCAVGLDLWLTLPDNFTL